MYVVKDANFYFREALITGTVWSDYQRDAKHFASREDAVEVLRFLSITARIVRLVRKAAP